jgi:hypothetical protein
MCKGRNFPTTRQYVKIPKKAGRAAQKGRDTLQYVPAPAAYGMNFLR